MPQDSTTLEDVRRAVENRLSSVLALSETLVAGMHDPLEPVRRDIEVLRDSLTRLRYQLEWMCGPIRTRRGPGMA